MDHESRFKENIELLRKLLQAKDRFNVTIHEGQQLSTKQGVKVELTADDTLKIQGYPQNIVIDKFTLFNMAKDSVAIIAPTRVINIF